jgi:hypothetical protein
MTKRPEADLAPPVREWREKEARLREEAKAWVRTRLQELFQADDTYTEYTTADVLRRLEKHTIMPQGWAMLVGRSDTVAYQDRYNIVRNALEVMAKHKQVVCGSTINKNGVEGTTTYARPRNVLDQWKIEIDGGDVSSITEALREVFASRGNILQDARAIFLARNEPGGETNASTHAGTHSDTGNAAPKRRKPRSTRGGS